MISDFKVLRILIVTKKIYEAISIVGQTTGRNRLVFISF